MPSKPTSSPIFVIAFVLSLALAGIVAFLVIAPNLRKQAETGETAVAAVANPTPAPVQPTPVSDATPVAAATPTPEATQAPTPTAESAVARIEGTMQGADGGLVDRGSIYIVPAGDGSVEETVKAAFEAGAQKIVASDELGFFEAEVASNRDFLIGIMLAGEPQANVQRIEKSRAGAKIEMTITMPRSVTVRGTVVDQDGTPVVGIPLKIESRFASVLHGKSPLQVTRLESGEQGGFQAAVTDPVDLTIAIDDAKLVSPYINTSQPIVVPAAKISAPNGVRADLEIIRGAIVAGRVITGEDETPVAGARVEMHAIGKEATSETTTAADGSFAFPPALPATFYVAASADGFVATQSLDHDPFKDPELVLTLQPLPTIVIDATLGAITSRATGYVALIGQGKGESARRDAKFEGGRASVEFDRVRPWQYLLVAYAESGDRHWYGERAISATDNSGDAIAIDLAELTNVTGRLVLDDKTPATDLQVAVNPADPTQAQWAHAEWMHRPVAGVMSGAQFTIENVPFGSDSLVVVSSRKTGKLLGSSTVHPGSADPLEIMLDGVGTIRGTVRNSRGEVCKGTLVLTTGLTLVDNQPGKIETREAPIGLGDFEFNYVPAGACRLSIKEQPDVSRLVTCVPGETTDVRMECREYVDVTFDFKGEPEPPLKNGEQFLIMSKPGTSVANSVIEMHFGANNARLEPGEYTMTRTQTMQSTSFQVVPRLDGELAINFDR